jgi:hypothetical protein
MEPTASTPGLPAREDDYRVRPAAPGGEAKSWVSDRPVSPLAVRERSRVYTHTAENFGRRETPQTEVEPDVDVEPALRPPPQWMLILAGAAVAALMGALLGGMMHI